MEEAIGQAKLGIIGGGFGLYGYAVASPWPVVTLDRYQKRFTSRNLGVTGVTFVDDLDELISHSDFLALAIPPREQEIIVPKIIGKAEHLFLEKPFAATGQVWLRNLQFLRDSSQPFSVNYAFVQTDWWKQVFGDNVEGNYVIDWHHHAPPEAWKLDRDQGGGIAGYYGIHFTPALGLGFSIVRASELGPSLRLDLARGLANVSIRITVGNRSIFSLSRVLDGKEVLLASQRNPFDDSIPGNWKNVDPRVENLRTYLSSFGDSQEINDAIKNEEFGAVLMESFSPQHTTFQQGG